MNSIYQFTVPVFIKHLKALDGILIKTQTAVQEQGWTEAEMMESRLAPDMFPFKKQIQVACDNAKGATCRLAGVDVPVHADDEITLADLRTRIQKTLEIVLTCSEDAFTDAATRHITLPYFPNQFMTGWDYAREYALPNFFFHVTTAYAILRQKGLAIGKADYMGGLPLQPEV